jgi:inner membrane protein YidH
VPERFDEARDATRRTRLANERTYLAWWRTGLTALAVSFGAGRLLPELSKGSTTWPYEVIGAAFAVVGVGFIVQGWYRQRRIEDALDRGEYASLGRWESLVFAVAGALLGVGALVLVVWRP